MHPLEISGFPKEKVILDQNRVKSIINGYYLRKSGRVAECVCLENRSPFTGTVGSNPTSSVFYEGRKGHKGQKGPKGQLPIVSFLSLMSFFL